MTWTSPFHLPGRWLKGNLHTHTTQSDGLYTPEQAMAWYQERGYDFLAISDHWCRTPGQRLSDDFITVTAAELDGPGYHMLTLGLQEVPDRALAASASELANEIANQGGLAYFAHPYWMGQTSHQIAETSAMAGIEVFNSVCEAMDGLGHASVQWDELLSQGLRLNGLAVDDVHWKHGAEGQGFVMVRAAELSEQAILEALREGMFYASTGPTILDLAVTRDAEGQPALSVRCSPCATITFLCRGPKGHCFRAIAGEQLDHARWPITSEQGYVRVTCQDASGRTAWSQALFVDDILSQ